MKQKFIMVALLLMSVHLQSFAQNKEGHLRGAFPLVTDDGISEITVSGDIDVILAQDNAENVRVKASDHVISRIRVSLEEGKLSLSPARPLKEGERLAVYVWVNNLEKLSLTGNAFATSVGILHSKNLHISADRNAIVLLKSAGTLWFDTPSNYQVAKGDGYSFIRSGSF